MVAIPDITQQKCMLPINKGIDRAIGFATESAEVTEFCRAYIPSAMIDNI